MPSGHLQWDDEFDYAFNSPNPDGDITAAELRSADVRFSLAELRDMFEDGFMTTAEASDVGPDDRFVLRELYFDVMDALGYYRDDFDWDAWRDAYGAQT